MEPKVLLGLQVLQVLRERKDQQESRALLVPRDPKVSPELLDPRVHKAHKVLPVR